ncbi:YggS family pyridoxal phosphate-dependent enzyme [Salisaeta longa]|uniref:YggS family pyridoxal phosphate-dependent enzyme n=1 Tax=Salisaeta longa TaxID=503170 RepID=UPI0003B5BFD6|nr:YggS family pyridoxal phosphate-dependent enzyme [Salisaeta longa]
MPSTSDTQLAHDAVAARVAKVRARIEAACDRADRSPDDITLVAVSKTFPMQAIDAGQAAGLMHFGENRARQLRDKAKARPGQHAGGDVIWRMIGHLQTNKAKFVARHADAFDALDSPRLAEELNKRAAKNDRVLPCLVQVNISGADQKYGLPPQDTHAFLDALADHEHLAVRGLMAMASFTEDPEDVRDQFKQMHELFATYDARNNPRVTMETLSTGMSNDFEVAIEEGSTMVRLGTAVFGPRSYD